MPAARWYKGNIHTHTDRSDGDSPPEKVISWYRRSGYDFLVLSDHNHLTLLDYASGRRRRRPLMVPGEEVSLRIHSGEHAIHLGAIGISRLVEPIDAGETVPTLQANVDAILEAGGVAAINHPNYTWAFDHRHIAQVRGASLLEVFNGHPAANQLGAPGRPSYEEIWDGVLSAGRNIYGVATDDAHDYRWFSAAHRNPGRGWVVVRAEELTSEAVIEALATGDFYASTGVTLAELEVADGSIALRIDRERDYIYTTRFVGRDGRVLAEAVGDRASYHLKGDEPYVRASVTSSSGQKAWTQPIFGDGHQTEPSDQHPTRLSESAADTAPGDR